MTSTESLDFFVRLPLMSSFRDVSDIGKYSPAPDDWSLVITDVQGSTKAIEAGRYKDVNTLGVGSIVAVCNALKGTDIPFVFGGDGATLLVPTSMLDKVKPALRGLRNTAKEVFDLGLRVGIVPISELNAQNQPVLLARYSISENITLAMFAGTGMTVGEKMVKDPVNGHLYAVDEEGPSSADFDGFECRWRPIENMNGQVVSLMVQEQDGGEGSYARVLDRFEQILGGTDGRPVSSGNMQLSDDSSTFNTEASLKTGTTSGLFFLLERFKISILTALGRFLLRTKKNMGGFPGKVYLQQVISNSDFRKFDDTLRMVLDLTNEQYKDIEEYLESEYQAGTIVYGLHSAGAALMTCVIERHEGAHVHFVDGSDGGYALAAKGMKAQLKKIKAAKEST
jgi:hypothetical protein